MKLAAKLNSYLQLIRVPNGFTAIADSWTGYIIYAGISFTPLLYLAIASFCLYSMGIVVNDLHDYSFDAEQYPYRPLPSGKINRFEAILLAIVLTVIAGVLCGLLGIVPLLVGSAVFISIMLYDIFFKKTRFAPAWMGACRMFNIMLGMSAASSRFYDNPMVLISIVLLIYVIMLTIASKHEDNRKKGILIFYLLFAWVVATYFLNAWVDLVTHKTGFMLLAIWAVTGGIFFLREKQKSSLSEYRKLTVFFIFSITVFDALYATGIQGTHAGLLVLSCLIPTVVLSFRYSGH